MNSANVPDSSSRDLATRELGAPPPAFLGPPSPMGRMPAPLPAQPSLFMEYWDVISAHKLKIALCAILGFVLSLAYTVVQTPLYQAHASVKIAGMPADALQQPDAWVQTQIKLLQSETLRAKVIAKLTPQTGSDSSIQSGVVARWRRLIGLNVPTKSDALTYASNNIVVRASGNTSIVDLVCDSTDNQVAAQFANTLAAEYIAQTREDRPERANADVLATQVEKAKARLEASERELDAAERAAAAGSANVGNEERIRQSQNQLSQAKAERAAKQTSLELAKSKSPDTLGDILQDHLLQELRSKITDARRQLAELSAKFTPAHYKVKEVQTRINELEASFDKQRNDVLKRIQNDYDAAVQREKLAQADLESARAQLTAQGDPSVRVSIARREVEVNRRGLDRLMEQVRETRGNAVRSSAAEAAIVDSAGASRLPYKPNIVRNVLFGTMIGVFLGIAFVVMRERTDRTFQNPGEIPHYLGVAELGVIPSAKSDRSAGMTQEERVELASWKNRSSAIAEGFRAAVASILFATNARRSNLFVLTSSAPAEGKSTVATNLAMALAESRRRVLLVDADMRKPRLHSIFGLENGRGLRDLLESPEPLPPGGLKAFIRPTGIPGLDLLVSGDPGPSISELLYSPRLAELIAECRASYDTVLFDTPPMLQMPDARLLGRVSDGVILVVRAGATMRDAAQAACQRLREDQTTIIGALLNGWDVKNRGGYGYGNSYGGYASKELKTGA